MRINTPLTSELLILAIEHKPTQLPFMDMSNQILLLELIQEAFNAHVLDQFGTTMGEAYLLDDWTTDEGFLVNGITKDGLIYDVEDQGRTLFTWDILNHSTLQEVLIHLNEESFA